jgi:hypothetical protein
VGSSRSSAARRKQNSAFARLTAEAEKAVGRADEAKQRVRLAKAELKKARKMSKIAKRVAKQARKKAAALAPAPEAAKPKAAARAAPPQTSSAAKPARPRRAARPRKIAHKSSAAAVARTVIKRMALTPAEAAAPAGPDAGAEQKPAG